MLFVTYLEFSSWEDLGFVRSTSHGVLNARTALGHNVYEVERPPPAGDFVEISCKITNFRGIKQNANVW